MAVVRSILPILVLVVAVCLFPILWICLISFKKYNRKYDRIPFLWVENPTLSNF